MRLFPALLALALAAPALGQDRQPPKGGPYVHRIGSASSADGLAWTLDEGTRLEHASLPCAVALKDRILLYYVDADRGAGMSANGMGSAPPVALARVLAHQPTSRQAPCLKPTSG